MLFKEVHTFYTEFIEELDKEGKIALAAAEQKLSVLAGDVKTFVSTEEQSLLKQYASAQPAIQEAVQAAIQALEQAIVSAFTKNGV